MSGKRRNTDNIKKKKETEKRTDEKEATKLDQSVGVDTGVVLGEGFSYMPGNTKGKVLTKGGLQRGVVSHQGLHCNAP